MTAPVARWCRYLWLPAFLMILTGCSLLSGVGLAPEEPSEVSLAREVIAQLRNVNQDLSAFKGIGSIKLWDHSREITPFNERAAWVAALPQKLRLAVLASGRPVFKLAADGRYLYWVDLTNPEHSFRKMRATDPGLKRLIALPVKSSDVVALLSGRTPIVDHSSATLVEAVDGGGYILILKKWWTVVEKVYLDRARDHVRQIEYFNYDGTLRYRAQFERMQDVQGYRVPMQLLLSNDSGIGLRVNVTRFIADASVAPSMFVLSPPKI